ncbi:MAG: zf-HC2 domain-containing protein [Chlamydiae bacterium]|nr:zf-HC2 domain-containing protein [Chlamydiota bacterium]MBI3265708.1 zf-HC2 domain-containing protein [Chlamydiota bacterium]
MKCPEAKLQLYLFLDNELGVQENLEILTHLDLCPSCSEFFEGEKQLQEFFKEKLKKSSVPEVLWEKIRPPLLTPRAKILHFFDLRRHLVIWGSAIAATLTLVATLSYYFIWPQKLNADTLVNQSVELHKQFLNGGISSQMPRGFNENLERARAFFSQKSGIYISHYNLEKLGYAPRSICLASGERISGQPIATILYFRGSHQLSHFILKDPAIDFPENLKRVVRGRHVYYYFYRVPPYKIIIFRNGQNLCVFVGRMKQNEVEDLATLAGNEVIS